MWDVCVWDVCETCARLVRDLCVRVALSMLRERKRIAADALAGTLEAGTLEAGTLEAGILEAGILEAGA